MFNSLKYYLIYRTVNSHMIQIFSSLELTPEVNICRLPKCPIDNKNKKCQYLTNIFILMILVNFV